MLVSASCQCLGDQEVQLGPGAFLPPINTSSLLIQVSSKIQLLAKSSRRICMEEPFSWPKPNPISVPTSCDFAAGLCLCPPPARSSQPARQPGGARCARRRRGAMASLHEYHGSMSHIVTHSWIILDDFGWFQTTWHNFSCWPFCSTHKTSNWGQIQYTLYISRPTYLKFCCASQVMIYSELYSSEGHPRNLGARMETVEVSRVPNLEVILIELRRYEKSHF